MGGAEVTVSTFYESYPAGTDADGRFSLELTILAPTPISVDYRATPQDQTDRPAFSAPVAVTVDEAPTRIIADVAPSTVDVGEEVVLSGRIEYQNAGVWHPYGGVTVEAWYEGTPIGGPALEFLTADADGRFRLAEVLPRSGNWRVEYHGIADWFHQDAVTLTPAFRVIQSAAINDFTASRNGDQVTLGGRLALSDPIVLPSAAIDIQYSQSGLDPWTTVTTLTAAGEDYAFSGQVPFRGAGFWRAHFAGDGRDHPPATSSAVCVC